MDEENPTSFISLRRKALEAEAELLALANVFRLAIRGVKEPESITVDEIRLLAQAVLKHVRPTVSNGLAHP